MSSLKIKPLTTNTLSEIEDAKESDTENTIINESVSNQNLLTKKPQIGFISKR